MPDLRQLFDEIIRFEIELWNGIDARLKADCSVPLTHFEPMSVMDRLGPCRVLDIASELRITTGGASKLVDRIEASGHCRRRPNPADRRSSLLELTAAGRTLLAQARTAFDDELEHRLGTPLPGQTLRQFTATLRSLRAAGDALGQDDQPAGGPAPGGPAEVGEPERGKREMRHLRGSRGPVRVEDTPGR